MTDEVVKLKPRLSQRSRLIIALIYLTAGSLLAWVKLGRFPGLGSYDVWFWSGYVVIVVGTLLDAPWYTKPIDALTNAIGSLIAALGLNPDTSVAAGAFAQKFQILGIALSSVGIIIALTAIWYKDSESMRLRYLAFMGTKICAQLGAPSIMFGPIMLSSLIWSFYNQVDTLILMTIVLAVLLFGRPLERGWGFLSEAFGRGPALLRKVGKPLAWNHPGIVEFELDASAAVAPRDVVVICAPGQEAELGIVVDLFVLSDRKWGRTILTGVQLSKTDLRYSVSPGESDVGIFKVNPAQLPEDVRERLGEHPISIRADSFLGLVSDQTDILHLVFDLLTPHPELAEGSLVTTEINNDRVVYQIVNATVKERGLDAQSVRGVLSVEAVKLGKWTDAGPEPVKWVPRPNTPVFLVPPKGAAFDLSTVGVVPRSSVYVRPDINRMVHHNTAIIGVLGAGKSTIAYQIIHRMIREGINVLVIDITDQYSISLSHLFREDENRSRTTKIQMAIAPTVNRVDQSPERGGNIVDFRRALAEEMNSFMDGEDRLWIVNPQHFDVTMQEGRPSGSAAAFRHLSMVEITKHVAEAALTKVQADGLSESARLCIVLEEAHSLVPEFNSAASKQDQEAAVGTARVVMQGRKYGLGFLVVTQRTANVSKSVLNQCHTVVALRNFDLRAQEFLEPYLGPHFVRVLPTLEQHHGIVYGPGFNLQQPLLVKFWDYEEFKNAALEQWGSQILTERGVGEAEVAEENLSLDDEVPF